MMAPATDAVVAESLKQPVARDGGWRGLWRSSAFVRALVSVGGLSVAALRVPGLYNRLEWDVLIRSLNTKPPLLAEPAWLELEGLLASLARTERVFAWLAVLFVSWAFRGAPASRWPACVAQPLVLSALLVWLHVTV
ncbi:hypothetical protein [Corallococcus terminator]|uniref:hypothetical protein n=1 Tax=Corallococcus terminator TaxID=2316733 RepID=UPI0011C3FCE1|nr:hypothetical protein [Corallococcus terminator]